jgi:acyl dehydratase
VASINGKWLAGREIAETMPPNISRGIRDMATVTLATIKDFIGKDLGTSDWIGIDKTMIDQFAGCTGDRQWIHTDVERARKESPVGTTIAHGFLSLALTAPLAMQLGLAPTDASAVFNYGLNKVRFITPVKCGDRVRLQLTMMQAERRDDGQVLITSRATLQIENHASPALVAESLTLVAP